LSNRYRLTIAANVRNSVVNYGLLSPSALPLGNLDNATAGMTKEIDENKVESSLEDDLLDLDLIE
jgi:predicted component of type VI protein secretion system